MNDAVCRALRRVGLPDDQEFRRRFPAQISVGQAQRVLIAIGVMHQPPLLIADEPTSALDAVTQSEILHTFTELNQTMGCAVLYISHDLQSVASICPRVAILHDGEIVESGRTMSVLRRPLHTAASQLRAVGAVLRAAGWIWPAMCAEPGIRDHTAVDIVRENVVASKVSVSSADGVIEKNFSEPEGDGQTEA